MAVCKVWESEKNAEQIVGLHCVDSLLDCRSATDLALAASLASCNADAQAKRSPPRHVHLQHEDVIRAIYDLLGASLKEVAGIHINAGKTRTWNRAGVRPLNLDHLDEDVWCTEGVQVLGTPVRMDTFVG